jgi:hypothetical protein
MMIGRVVDGKELPEKEEKDIITLKGRGKGRVE